MDNLCFGLSRRVAHVWSGRKIRASIRQEYREVFGEEFFSLYPDQLSERQKCRLVYTRILLQRPRAVFCIQPFKGADLPHRMFIWQMLKMLLDKRIAVVILAGAEQRCLNLQSLLRERKIRSAVDFQLHGLPQPGSITIAVGGRLPGSICIRSMRPGARRGAQILGRGLGGTSRRQMPGPGRVGPGHQAGDQKADRA